MEKMDGDEREEPAGRRVENCFPARSQEEEKKATHMFVFIINVAVLLLLVGVFSHRLNSYKLSLKFLQEPPVGRLRSQLSELHLGVRHLDVKCRR